MLETLALIVALNATPAQDRILSAIQRVESGTQGANAKPGDNGQIGRAHV